MTVLDRSWKNCLRMWKWISEHLPGGFSELDWDDKVAVLNALKRQWLTQYRFTKNIDENCFFCDYAHRRIIGGCDSHCPGKMVNRNFHCNPSGHNIIAPSWVRNPEAFYERLIELNKIRKAQA